MYSLGMFFGFTILFGGAAAVVYGTVMSRRTAGGVEQYLQDLDEGDLPVTDDFQRRLSEPFLVRVVRPMTGGVWSVLNRFTPAGYLENVHKKILVAGLSSTLRAEEFVVGQVACGVLATLSGIAYVALTHPAGRWVIIALVLTPVIGLTAPESWLSRKVTERKMAIRKDLPDTLDLLAISVEAGMGFEGALDIVCRHFSSPLADEFARTLREMELGLPRKDAFQNLKRRTQVPELSNFVLAILQADALGIPIGRVLRTQAVEMRAKRRQWAREKAAKLPVKILFPLMAFIFPAIMIVIIGPGVPGIMKALS
ncbi:MAG: type II secretion system F family protein [Actinomycetota bacterium]|nr:type II secretion system F family protein [Actinomycetota bacterium]